MKKAAIYSAILHVAIVVILIFGLYNPFSRTLTNQPSMMIDFVQIAEQSAAPKLTPNQSAKPAAKPKPKPEEKPKPEPEPTPQQPEEKPAPKEEPTPPTPQPETKPEPAPIPPEKPKKREEKKPPVIKPKLKPKAELSVEKKKDTASKKAQAKKKPQKDSFDEILEKITGEPTETDSNIEGAPASKVGDTLTASEIDLIRQQIAKCWNFPAGAKGDQDLVVDIELEIDQDGNVTKAEIVDEARMSKDPFFRTAAESAKRAVLNPQCSPLKLPPDKYNQWKHMILGFNPKDLFQ